MNWGGLKILYVKLNLAHIHKEHSPVLIPNMIDWGGQQMREWATSGDLDHFRLCTLNNNKYTEKESKALSGDPPGK